MATRVDLSHFSFAQLKQLTPKTYHRERIAYILSPLQAVLWPILCLHLSLFVTLSTRVGLAKEKLSTPKKPLFGGKMWGLMRQLVLWQMWC